MFFTSLWVGFMNVSNCFSSPVNRNNMDKKGFCSKIAKCSIGLSEESQKVSIEEQGSIK